MILGQLSASIVHEINPPISAVVTNAEIALRLLGAQPTNTEAIRELLACILEDGMRAGHQRCTGPDKACQHSLLPSDEKCRKCTADTKYGDDGKNNRRISRVVHEASYKRFPKPRTCIRYEVEETSCGP